MTAAERMASIKRHFRYLWRLERHLYKPTDAERNSVACSRAIARRMGARLPGIQA